MPAMLSEIAQMVGGELIGDGGVEIRGAAPCRDAQPGEITLFDSTQRGRGSSSCQASAAIVPRDFSPNGMPVIRVDDVHRAFISVMCHFRPPRPEKRRGISPTASVSPTARLADNVEVYPLAVIGDDVEIGPGTTIHAGAQVMSGSRIGSDVTIFPSAVLYENTVVGDRCIIHAGAVLGAYGFGYDQQDGRHVLSAQLGNVVLGNDVEVGAGTTIDRGTYGPTSVGEGTKIDDLVMIAHNCRIGRHNMLCSQVGIAGSTSTGDYVVMAGQVGVRDHVHIGTGAVLGAMAGVSNDVPDGQRMIGIPATPEREQKLKQAALSKLPEMRRQMKQLQRTIDRLSEQLEGDESRADDNRRPITPAAGQSSRRAVA